MTNLRKKISSRKKIKKGISISVMLVLLCVGLITACNSSSKGPTQPFATNVPKTPTASPTGTFLTSTPTLAIGVNTPTFTPTFDPTNQPVYKNNYGTAASPNGIVINGSTLAVAEFENKGLGPVAFVQEFNISGANVLDIPGSETNYVFQGYPTPNSTPPWAPVTTVLNGPKGFVNPGGAFGYSTILDLQSGGGALLYFGNVTESGWSMVSDSIFYQPFSQAGYGGISFNNPKALTADDFGYVYVADTGNKIVEQFYADFGTGNMVPQHYWTGNAGVPFGAFSSVTFKSPSAVACDTSTSPATIWVGDSGYSPSVVESFSSGGTTITGAWSTLPKCVISGLAVDSTTHNVYVADSGNNLVEIYQSNGTLITAFGDPHSPMESLPFAPSCIAFDSTYNVVYVGDTANDLIIAFQAP